MSSTTKHEARKRPITDVIVVSCFAGFWFVMGAAFGAWLMFIGVT